MCTGLAAAAAVLSGCLATTVDSGADASIVRTSQFVGMEEAFTGELRTTDAGCIVIEREGVEYLLVWPDRAEVVEQSGAIGVEIDDEFLAVGTDVNIAGGGGTDGELAAFAPDVPTDCAGINTFYLVNTTTPVW